MAAAWEYITVHALASNDSSMVGAYEAVLKEAGDSWRSQLNARGAEGWELVSERFASGRGSWAEYRGTMKRPISSAE
jgi:hypothetical protein